MPDDAHVGQAFQPVYFRAFPVAGWKACPTRLMSRPSCHVLRFIRNLLPSCLCVFVVHSLSIAVNAYGDQDIPYGSAHGLSRSLHNMLLRMINMLCRPIGIRCATPAI
ncbi:MAG: hypothetical protein FJY85_05040 [Deltaproteobacteria bacterium]|nr:hypothetical protein [Deltaproteobacteria bacterium]